MSNLIFTPGFYTKVRLDDEGHIVEAENLEKEDLPLHQHSVNEINKAELKDTIAEILATFFANTNDTSVRFVYDSRTKTVSADVDIDDESITKNEYGQLIAVGGAEGSGEGFTPETDISDISNQLETFRSSIPEIVLQSISRIFANDSQAAVVFNWDPNTKTYSADLRYDGISISKDENGDLIATGSKPGDGGDCASHTHTSSQIEDFDEAVKALFEGYSKNIQFNLNQYIDGDTIKVNEYGQLVAVRTALEKHTHTLADIKDYKAPLPAAQQAMSDLGDEINYDSGVIDFSKLNIGYSILALSQYLENVVKVNIDNLTRKINSIRTQGDNPGIATLSIANTMHNRLYDKTERDYKEVYYLNDVRLILDYLPYDDGQVVLMINGSEAEVADVANLLHEGQQKGSFKVKSVYSKNSYTAKVLEIDPTSHLVLEGVYNIRISFQRPDGRFDRSNTITLATTPNLEVSYLTKDTTASHEILNTSYYNYPEALTYEVRLQGYNSLRFVPKGWYSNSKSFSSNERHLTQSIENLFYETVISIDFEKTVEHSDCYLIKLIKDDVLYGAVINNVLTPLGAGCTIKFELPNSEMFNTVQIYGDLPIENVSIFKGNLIAKGLNEADYGAPGRVDENTISFVDAYDPGRDRITLKIETAEPVNLAQLEFKLLVI